MGANDSSSHAAEFLQPRLAAAAATGRIAGFINGRPWVIPARGERAFAARSTIDLQASHVGREVVLLFEAADESRPIVVGLLRDPDYSEEVRTLAARHADTVEIIGDGQRVVVSARNQLVLRCGAASITLTAAGKVLILGKYVSSRSEGVNRISGGSVHLN